MNTEHTHNPPMANTSMGAEMDPNVDPNSRAANLLAMKGQEHSHNEQEHSHDDKEHSHDEKEQPAQRMDNDHMPAPHAQAHGAFPRRFSDFSKTPDLFRHTPDDKVHLG